ncbi:MAG TPA: GTPase domain-containing protein [Propionicimonas sp.]|nr:GTPase domain-containing protein [Propionicimonas sp.]
MGAERLSASLTRLREALAGVRLPLELPSSAIAQALVRGAVDQLDDYILPRLDRLDAPLLAVIGGSTGAGKSTLVNSLLGRVVSNPGVIRPTTRSPVLVHHPDDAEWFSSGKILPGLARTTSSANDARTLHVVPEPGLPRGLAILDAPDVDSVVAENRALAAQLLAAADLWLFVTSAARYADAVPWEYLRSAAKRQAVVAVVLDRVPPAAMDEVPAHLGQMMGQRGLGGSPLFAVPETEVDADGLLPDSAVAPIRDWLGELAADVMSRNQVVLQTLNGAIGALVTGAPQVVSAIQEQVIGLETLRADAERSFAEAVRTIVVQTADGTLLRGEVLARWHDFVGTGEFFRAVEQKIGWMRDRLVAAVKGEPKQAVDAKVAVESGMEVLIREEGEAAARRVESAWQAHPVGRQLLATTGDDLGRASRDYPVAAARTIRDWQGDVLDLVVREGGAKKSAARFWALGVNGVGVALMVLVFSQTGGLVGAEIGVAGGTAVLAQRVLEAIFGEDAVRRLAKQAKRDLDARVEALMAAELARYTAALDAVDVRPEQAGEILAAVEDLDDVRSSDGRLQVSSPAQAAVAQRELGASAPAALEAAAGPPLEGEIIENRQDQQ